MIEHRGRKRNDKKVREVYQRNNGRTSICPFTKEKARCILHPHCIRKESRRKE